jgi:hypothetical protein
MGLKSWIAKMAVNYAKPLIKAELTVDGLANYAVEGVDWAASSATRKVSDERLAQIAKGCNLGASVLGNIAAAIDPASDGGRQITDAEKQPIRANMREAVLLIVTQEQLNAQIDAACARVIEKIS